MPCVRRLILLCCAIVLVDTMFYAAITPLLPHYVNTLGLSKTAAGVLSGAYAAGTLVGALPGGILAARMGVKPTVLTGLACMAAASLVFAFGHDVVLLDGARFVQGAGGAASWAGALAWLIAGAPAGRRGELIGTALGAAIAGGLLGPVLGGVGQAVGPEPAFVAVALLGVLLAAWAWTTAPVPRSGAGKLRDAWRSLRDRRVAAGMWLIALPGLLFGTIGVLATLSLNRLGTGGTTIAVVWLCAAGLEAVVSPVVGRMSDRHGRMLPVRAALTVAPLVMVAFALAGSAVVVGGLVLLAAPVIGILWAPASALLSDGAEGVGLDQALGVALLNFGWAAGQVTGSAASAAVAQAAGDAVPYAALAVVCAGTLALLVGTGWAGVGARLSAR
jgi:predicted MFS family arabinose efflux permease